MTDSLRVFISYARSDSTAFADELLTGLEVAGFEPFLDRHDIAAGEDWEARLGGLIQSADTVVFVISPGAVKSERCAWEVQRAEGLSKRIIPVVAIDVSEAETPPGLKRLNYIFFSEGHSFTKGLAQLSTALRVDFDWIREHTRLAELAARWRGRANAEPLLLRGSELEAAKSWLSIWQAPAPAPTELHRAFIGESENAEALRFSAERKQLEEIATAQAEKEKALKRLRMSALTAGVLVVVLFLATVAGGVVLWRTDAQLSALSVSLHERDAALSRVQSELQGVLADLEISRLSVASSQAERDERDRQLAALRARLDQSERALVPTRRIAPAQQTARSQDGGTVSGTTSLGTIREGADGRECRQVRETYVRDGQEHEQLTTYCRDESGAWSRAN